MVNNPGAFEEITIRIAHIITGLEIGGAEQMLVRLLGSMDRERITSSVLSLSSLGPLAEQISKLDVDVANLDIPRGVGAIRYIPKITNWIKQKQPDVVQTWMYHADMLGGLASRLAKRKPLAWGVHHGAIDVTSLKPSTLQTVKLCARMSGWLPQRIVCPSHRSRQEHLKVGYTPSKWEIIPNGFDGALFNTDRPLGAALRREIGIVDDAPVIGIVGRFDPAKDYGNFLDAAKIIANEIPSAQFVLVGTDVVWENPALAKIVEDNGLLGRCHLLGPRSDMLHVYNTFDVFVLSSIVEGFPMVIGEAMSCGLPCVVTDVGDCRQMVGDAGKVVPPSDPSALARATIDMMSMPDAQRRNVGVLSRQRIVDCYSIESVSNRYLCMYQEISGKCVA